MPAKQRLGLIIGICLFSTVIIAPAPDALSMQARHVLAITLLMASWWISEAIPIAATALLPVLLFPLLGVMPANEVTRPYGHHIIFLFLGGFLIAATIEKWQLHKRIALYIINIIGASPNRIILGFMLATAFLSMWISNAAASIMMITIAMAVLKQMQNDLARTSSIVIDETPGSFQFGVVLMIGIAYSASIGGMATLIGTPPNAIMAGILEEQFGSSISFGKWMLFGMPLSIIMLGVTWVYLTKIAYKTDVIALPNGLDSIKTEIQTLGQMTIQEKTVLIVFLCVAFAWIGRSLIDHEALALINDSTIAMAGALILFILPAGKGEFILEWRTASKVPWHILILFGGGFALAKGFIDSGLTEVIALQLQVLDSVDTIWLILATVAVVVVLTEVTSNTATSSMSLPIVAALAIAVSVHPFCLAASVSLAASCAFMLPVATPPNAIAYSSQCFTISQMTRAGIWMNLFSIIIITLFISFYMPAVWDIDINTFSVSGNNISLQ